MSIDDDIGMNRDTEGLLRQVGQLFTRAGLALSVRPEGVEFVVDLIGRDGTTFWPNFAKGPDRLVALVIAEQRYLVEEVGSGSMPGEVYLEKAKERLRRWQEDPEDSEPGAPG
jgi:hypothetical protein